jgi:hypothetical protein
MATVQTEVWNPSPDEERAFRATDETFQWLCALPADAVRAYAGKWIAGQDRKVIAVADSLDALLAELKGIDLQSVIIDRIERQAWMVYR